jgi:uncharacterized repeat protein (TIGR03833 family)
MFKPSYEQIQPGSTVLIRLGHDEDNSHEAQGMVEEVLDQSNHPLGVEVRLMDGRIGRVQRILDSGTATQHPLGHTSQSQYSYAADQSSYSSTPFHESQSPWQAHETPQVQSHTQRRTNLEEFPVSGQERSEQVEVMQNYESQVAASEDDMNQAKLEKEFPSIDASLIAAIYGDSKDLATTREMLQELGGT